MTAETQNRFSKSFPLAKVDEAKQEVAGCFTAEVVDSDDEIADFDFQSGQIKKWSDGIYEQTKAAGQEPSYGNVRYQHSMQPAGKVLGFDRDEAAKTIGGNTYIDDPTAWRQAQKGILTGFSFGGRYLWRKCNTCSHEMPLASGENYCASCKKQVIVRYGAEISELSIVDRPAVPVANILHIKASGARVMEPVSKEPTPEEIKAKRDAFIASDLKSMRDKLSEKAKSKGITVEKGMWEVGAFAQMLEQLSWLRYQALAERDYEDDGSTVPDDLTENLENLIETFLAMAEEEATELQAAVKAAGKVTTMAEPKDKTAAVVVKTVEVPEDVQDTLTEHLADSSAHHESMSDAHEAKAKEHEEVAKMHKAHEAHFKARSEEGGDDAEDHEMTAKMHKGMAEHHEAMADHEMKMAKCHDDMEAKCAKVAKAVGGAEKADAALKAAKAAMPAIVAKSAATTSGNTGGAFTALAENASATERAAYAKAEAEWFASDEYKNTITEDFRKRTQSKLHASASGNPAAIVVGAAHAETLRVVPRTGDISTKNNKAAVEVAEAEEVLGY
jgi:hypothetical protein